MLIKHLIKTLVQKRMQSFRLIVLLLCAHFYCLQGNVLHAQVTTLQNWTNLYNNSTSNALTLPYTVPVGTNTNRLLVVAVATSTSPASARTITPITYGGRNLTAQISDLSTSLQQHTVLYYLKESDLDLAANTNLVITINTGTTRVNAVWASVFDKVDQTNTIADSKNYNNGSTASSTGQFATALNIPANAQPVMVFSAYRSGNATARTISTFPTNWTRVSEITWATTDGVRNLVANKTISGTVSTDLCAYTLSGNSLVSMSAMSINSCIAPTANAGGALSAICKGGTSAALGGSVGGSATTGSWSDGGVGGTFNPNATTLNATYTPPAAYSGTVTLTLTTTNGTCSNVSASKTLTVTAPSTATISYSNASFCNSVLTAQACTITGT